MPLSKHVVSSFACQLFPVLLRTWPGRAKKITMSKTTGTTQSNVKPTVCHTGLLATRGQGHDVVRTDSARAALYAHEARAPPRYQDPKRVHPQQRKGRPRGPWHLEGEWLSGGEYYHTATSSEENKIKVEQVLTVATTATVTAKCARLTR